MSTWWHSLILLAQQEAPAGDAAEGVPVGINSILPLLPWIMIGVLFYLMLVRPERRKRAQLDAMLKNLKKNDRVVTVGGIYGTVVQSAGDADDVTLRIDENNNTRVRVLRSSISRVVSAEGSADSKET